MLFDTVHDLLLQGSGLSHVLLQEFFHNLCLRKTLPAADQILPLKFFPRGPSPGGLTAMPL